MKKIISSILVVFFLLLSSCSNKDYETHKFTTHSYDNTIVFESDYKIGCAPFKYFKNFSLEKYNIDYLFIGDELYIDGEIYAAGLQCDMVSYIEFANIKRVKIKRAPIINLRVSTYKENGVEYKKIVANNKKIILDKEYTNQDEIIFTGQTDLKNITYTDEYKYTYETLGDLKDGTRLSATYYEEDGITHIYAFYLRSYVNKVKYFSI